MKLIVVPKVAICKRLDELGFERAIPLINNPKSGERSIGIWPDSKKPALPNCHGTTCYVTRTEDTIVSDPFNLEGGDYLFAGPGPGYIHHPAMKKFLSRSCTQLDITDQDYEGDFRGAIVGVWDEDLLQHTAIALGKISGVPWFFHQENVGEKFDLVTLTEILRDYPYDLKFYMPPTAMA